MTGFVGPLESQDLQVIAMSMSEQAARIHGSVKIWGEWMGRAMDIDLHLAKAHADEGCLVLEFAEGATVRIDRPAHIAVSLQRTSLGTPVVTVGDAQQITVQQPTGQAGWAPAALVFEHPQAEDRAAAFALY